MVVDRADPGEMSSVEMALHLGPANRVMAPPNAPSIDAEQCFEAFAAFTGQVRITDAGRLDAPIFPEWGGQQPPWRAPPHPIRHPSARGLLPPQWRRPAFPCICQSAPRPAPTL